jgi:kinesin family protein 15
MAQPVQVAVRIRPEDISAGGRRAGGGGETETGAWLRGTASPFATVLSPQCSQWEVFSACGAPLVEGLFEGYHGCLFAYGQTGSGKTHSMLGTGGGRRAGDLDGIIPMVAGEVGGGSAVTTYSPE